MNIVLASTSPFRKKQLVDLNINFKAVPPLFDEDKFKLQNKMDFKELCVFLAKKKADSLIQNYPESLIIGSDQMLIYKNKMYNKPKNLKEVTERLSDMNNQTHTLITSLFIYTKQKSFSHIDETRLHMKSLSPEEIQSYAELDQPIGCAGGYKYELNGNKLFKSIETQDASSIVGLPTLKLKDILKQLGIHYG